MGNKHRVAISKQMTMNKIDLSDHIVDGKIKSSVLSRTERIFPFIKDKYINLYTYINTYICILIELLKM